jgi:hypothetical protein
MNMTPGNALSSGEALNSGEALGKVLDELEVQYENPEPGAFLVRLAGTHKLATLTWLIAGEHSLHVEAFFCRQPDENHAEFYRYFLERNGRMYGVHFAIDKVGDVYLTGRLPVSAITSDEIDRLLGCVLTYADETFDQALRLGFGSAIKREWAWRESRGESLANLAPFAEFVSAAKTRGDTLCCASCSPCLPRAATRRRPSCSARPPRRCRRSGRCMCLSSAT